MRQKSIIIAIIMLIVGVAFGMFLAKPKTAPNSTKDTTSATSENTSEQKPSEPVLTVETISPTPQTATQSIKASGAVVGKEVAQVGTKVSGLAIDKILVQVGDTVKAGQVLAILDDTSVINAISEAEASVVQAQANLQKAQNDLARVEPLVKIDAISRQQYESYQNAVINAKSQLQMATARFENSKISKNNTQVITPISGIISTKTAQIGMMTNGSVLFEIVKNGVLEWQATVAPSVASQIQIGQMGELFVGDNKIPVQVSRISPITNNARELIIHSTIAPSPQVVGGMYQSGQFNLSQSSVLALPQKVITTTDGRSYVWTLTKAGEHYKANKTQITTGERLGELIAVDLPSDTLVVKSGGNFLKDGDVVRLANDK